MRATLNPNLLSGKSNNNVRRVLGLLCSFSGLAGRNIEYGIYPELIKLSASSNLHQV